MKDRARHSKFIEHYFRMFEFSEMDGSDSQLKFVKDELKRHLILANIPADYHKHTMEEVLNRWDSFPENFQSSSDLESYYRKIEQMSAEGIGLYLSGAHGLLKTTAAAMILKRALELEFTAYFITMSDLVELVSSGWKDHMIKSKYQYIIGNVDFLVVDDIGREGSIQPNLATSSLDRLFVSRSNKKRPTIITSNHHIEPNSNVFGESLLTLFKSNLAEIRVYGDDIRYESSASLLKKLRSEDGNKDA